MYTVADRVWGKKLELHAGHTRLVVDRKKGLASGMDLKCSTNGGMVYVAMGAKVLEMTTPVAVKVGFALCKNGGACMELGDMVLFDIGGEEFTLLPAVAVQLGGAILLKADKADDFQRRLQ